jgi:hypothetical protein
MNRKSNCWALLAVVVTGIAVLSPGAAFAGSLGTRQPSCPPQESVRTINKNPRAATVLVPSGAQKVLLCRYFGGDVARAKQHRLARSKLITRHSIVESLTSEFDHLEVQIHHHCPRENGIQIKAFFIYRHEASDVVSVQLRRCSTVSNGRLQQEFRLSESLRRRLLRAV